MWQYHCCTRYYTSQSALRKVHSRSISKSNTSRNARIWLTGARVPPPNELFYTIGVPTIAHIFALKIHILVPQSFLSFTKNKRQTGIIRRFTKTGEYVVKALSLAVSQETPVLQCSKRADKETDGRGRHRFSAFWLRSKCSICSYQLNI